MHVESLWRAIDQANKYIVVTAPFKLAKDPDERGRVGSILNNLLEVLHQTAHLLQWFLPETSQKIFSLLQLSCEGPVDCVAWGSRFAHGQKVEGSQVLFPRIEVSK